MSFTRPTPAPALAPAALFLILLSGCSSTGQKPVDKINKAWVNNRSGYYVALAEGKAPSAPDPLAASIADGPARNVMIEDLLRLIDLDYENFATAIRRGKSYTDLTLDLVSIGLGTYGTLTGSSQAKTVLSALNTALAGGRASFDKNVLLEQTVPVLIAQMGAMRARQKLFIRQRMFSDPAAGAATSLAAYSVTAALTDLTEYYYAGTLTRALASVAEDAAAAKKKAEAKLKIIVGTYGADEHTDTLDEWLYPNGTIDKTRRAKLEEWIAGHVDPPVRWPVFMIDEAYADEREEAAADLAP